MTSRKNASSVFLIGALVLFAAVAAPPLRARADDAQQNLPATVEKRLKEFDPAAVAAARHYYTSPVLRASFGAMVPKITDAMASALDQANPGLDPQKKRLALDAVQQAVTAKIDLIIDLSMISALEVFSKDELIALDQFYSSPVGQRVLTKMPKVMAQLPAMMRAVMPLIIDDLRARIKAKGLDVRL